MATRQEDTSALRRQMQVLEQKLERITAISSAIIYVLDAQGRFTWLNSGVRDLLGYEPDELIGKHFSAIMTEEEYEKVGREKVLVRLSGVVTGDAFAPRLFDERRRGERRTRDMMVRLLTKGDHSQRVFRGEVSGIMAAEGYYDRVDLAAAEPVFVGSQGIVFDVTAGVEAQRHRNELERHFYETQKFEAVGRLAGGAAHHFNNKLGTILGYAELARQKHTVDNPELAQYLGHIVSATTQIADLTAQMLTFSCQGAYQKTSININKVVGAVCSMIKSSVGKKIRIIQNLEVHNSHFIGDPSMVQAAVLNVAMNACDAVVDGAGEIRFETTVCRMADALRAAHPLQATGGEFVRCRIVDNGIGMDGRVRERMFEPFFTTKPLGSGVGLGLACVHGCIEQHQGVIAITGSPGNGTCFDLYFPADTERANAGVGTASLPEALRGSGNVLVVDDDPDMRTVMHDMLVDLGYRVKVYTALDEATERLQRESRTIDCIIIDCSAISEAWIAQVRALAAVDSGIRTIISVGYHAGTQLQELASDIRGTIIQKPFDIAHLSRVVYDSVLARRAIDNPA